MYHYRCVVTGTTSFPTPSRRSIKHDVCGQLIRLTRRCDAEGVTVQDNQNRNAVVAANTLKTHTLSG